MPVRRERYPRRVDWIAVVPVAALVSATVTFLIRWLDAKRVAWLVTGKARESSPAKDGQPGRVRIEVDVHNVGNGDAFDVRLRRCNGADFPAWVTFEGGKVASGDAFRVVMEPPADTWETAWIEVMFRTTLRGRRSRPKTWRRVNLRAMTGPVDQMFWPDATGRGTDLPGEEEGRLK